MVLSQVWLAQAHEIDKLNPRNKSNEAKAVRKKMRGVKNVEKKIDKDIKDGKSLQLAAVKKILGQIIILIIVGNHSQVEIGQEHYFCS